MQKAETLIVT